MADIGTNTTNTATQSSNAISALQNFYTTFSSANQALLNKDVTTLSASEIKPIAQKNIQAVNDLLTSLMGKDAEREAAQQFLTTPASNPASNTATKISRTGSTATSLASYNTRVPYTEIRINGVKISPVIPNSYKTGEAPNLNNFLNVSGIECLFEDLELSMPLGGVNGTIRGTLKLYSRTPIELLAFITEGLNEQTANLIDDESGLPVCDVIVGWNIADGTPNGQTIRSPKLQFLVMNVQMTDPGRTMGSEFTLTLQDAGSASLGNTSANLGILPDYPQKQLRLLIEKCLGLRLFTLDDLLQLGSNNPNISSTSNTQYQNETFFVNPKATYLRLNSNILGNVINELCESIACRWYPVSNTNLETATTQAASAENAIESLRNQFQSASGGELDTLQKAFDDQTIKVANCSILLWIPYFPAGIHTTSNLEYLQLSDFTTTGAFLLLPKYIEDISINQANLPVIYGPGSSGIPYFYGGGQNVYQRLTQLNNSYGANGFANLVGEVQDLTLNFSSLVAVMKGTYDEEVFWRESGATLNPSAISKLSRDRTKSKVSDSVSRSAALQRAFTKANLPAGTTPEQALELFKQRMTSSFTATSGRFKRSTSQRKIFSGDSVSTLLNSSGTNRSYTNSSSMSTFSFGKLQERLGTFLQFPLTIGMRVMGDPFLFRQGIGVFEIINYYPTIDGQSFVFNPLVSGVYMPTTITHRISMGDYTTEIQAVKVPNNVANTATQTYSSILNNKVPEGLESDYNTILNDIMQVNLETLTVPGDMNLSKVNIPARNSTSYVAKISDKNQTQVLTSTILGNGLTAQMNAAFAQFQAINAAVQNPEVNTQSAVATPTVSTPASPTNAITENQ